jgi:hypothetical protein
MHRYVQVALALLLLPVYVSAADSATAIIKAHTFDEAFTDYYDALVDYGSDDLRLELSETIEDVLSSGSHLTRTSLDYKIQQIETGVFAHLRRRLCMASSPESEDLRTIKLVVVRSVMSAGEEAHVNFGQEDLGMISGVLVRWIQRTPPSLFCGGS